MAGDFEGKGAVNRSIAFPDCPMKGEPCDMFPDVLTPAYAIGWSLLWAFVASLLVFVVFQLTRRTGSDDAIALGCLCWVLLLILCGVLGTLRGDFVPVAVPVVAFGPAAVVIWRRRSSGSAHGEVSGKSA